MNSKNIEYLHILRPIKLFIQNTYTLTGIARISASVEKPTKPQKNLEIFENVYIQHKRLQKSCTGLKIFCITVYLSN